MIALLWLLFRFFLSRGLVDAARRQADRGLRGVMEGHDEGIPEARVRFGIGSWSRYVAGCRYLQLFCAPKLQEGAFSEVRVILFPLSGSLPILPPKR